MTLTDPTYQGNASGPFRIPAAPAAIDAEVWPGSPVLLQERRRPLPARRPARCSRRAARRLPLRIGTPTGPCWVPGDAGSPVMTMVRPEDSTPHRR